MLSFVLRRTRFAALLALAAIALPVSLRAQQAPPAPPVVLVVDVQHLLRVSKAAKAVQQQLEAQRATYQKDFSKQEADLRASGGELQRQQAILSRDALEAKGKELQQKYAELEREVQSKRQVLLRGEGEARNRILDTMIQIVQEIGQERRATLVLPKDAVLMVAPDLDVTDEVLKRLDQRLPSLTVSLNAPAQGQEKPHQPAAAQQAKSKSDKKKKE
jgi:Skp family chaperone for outer membrane proteins